MTVRFYQGYRWRWVIVGIDWATPALPELRIVSFLDSLAFDASYDRVLNDPCVINMRVPADSPEVNLNGWDDEPFVAEGVRALVGLRDERPAPGVVWVPRAAGILSQPRDTADVADGAGNAYSSLAAFDGWQSLYRRPVCHFDGTLPTPDYPLRFFIGEPADNVALQLLFNTEAAHGVTLIDSSALPGDSLPPLTANLEFDREVTVGQAWKALCDANLMDIRLDPILDLAGGYLWELKIEEQIGEARYDATFAWNTPGRSLASYDHLEDGTQRANKIKEFNGQAGALPTLTAPVSVNKYGEYWLVKAQSETSTLAQAQQLANDDLRTRGNGVTTINVSPTPERSAIPLQHYDVGDSIPVSATRSAVRKTVNDLWRVTKIPLRMEASGLERVEQLEVSSEELAET